MFHDEITNKRGKKTGRSGEELMKKIMCRRKVFHSLCFPVGEGHERLLSGEADFHLFSPTSFAVLLTSSPNEAADRASTRLVCKVLNRCSFLCTEFLNENEKKNRENLIRIGKIYFEIGFKQNCCGVFLRSTKDGSLEKNL